MKTSFLFISMLWVWCQSGRAHAAAELVSAADPRRAVAATAGGISGAASMTPDQRFVVFVSDAPNLTPQRRHPVFDVFLRDRALGKTWLISASADGTSGGDGDSLAPSVSTNGQWVAFHSDAGNLTPGDTTNLTDVFLHDVNSGATRLISVSPEGAPGDASSSYPVLAADGQRIAFESLASQLTAHDTNGAADVFVRDIASGSTILVSVSATGDAPGNGSSSLVDLTPDGRHVLFTSTSSNLVSGMTNRGSEVFVRDLTTGVTTWVSTNAAGLLPGPLSSDSKNPACDASGRRIVFQIVNRNSVLVAFHDLESGVTRLISSNNYPVYIPDNRFSPGWVYSADWSKPRVSGDGRRVAYVSPVIRDTTNYVNQVYLWDAESGATTLVSANGINGDAANASSDRPVLSQDGRTVVFVSAATDLTSDPAGGAPEVYVRDLEAGVTRLVSSNRFGAVSGAGDFGVLDLSPDGSRLLFETADAQMAEDDFNRAQDVFLRDLRAGESELISVRDPALASRAANGFSAITRKGLSADGRYAAFTSQADNLTAGDTSGLANVYRRDLEAGSTRLVSASPRGTNSVAGGATAPAINANGRFLAFASNAGDLAPGDPRPNYDVFFRDMAGAVCELVSATAAHTSPTNGWSDAPSIRADGGAVVFASQATELVNLGVYTTFFGWCSRDLSTHTTTVPGAGIFPNPLRSSGFAGFTSVPDVAVFEAAGGAILAGDLSARPPTILDSSAQDAALSANGRWLVYARPRQAIPKELVVWDLANHTNLVAAITGGIHRPSVSDDGRRIAFEAAGAFPANTVTQVFLYDARQDTRTLVSASRGNAGGGNANASFPQITADGRYVVFQSPADNLVANDRNGAMDVFARDLSAGTTLCLSLNSEGTGPGDGYSGNPVLSGNGRTVVFTSDAADLVPGDFNHLPDVFAVRLPAVAELRILTVDLSAPGNPIIRWAATLGSTYRVEYKSELSDPVWTEVAGEVTAAAATAEKADPSAIPAAQRFYRIQLLR